MRRARLLGPADAAAVTALVDADPVLNVFLASRLDAGVLDPHGPGRLWGYPAAAPVSLLHAGANVVPFRTDAAALDAFALELGPRRTCSSIVGPTAEAQALWERLAAVWGTAYDRPRAVRRHQPVLALAGRSPLAPDERVRAITREHTASYLDAAVAMYTEELGENPLATNPVGYRHYVETLIAAGRAFGIVERGRVVFKADIGAIGHGAAQIQGVWVHPERRGRGLAAPAMAAVCNAVAASGRISCLYVNDFNAPARGAYARCGFTQRGEFRTFLY